MKQILLISALCIFTLVRISFAQENSGIKWWNPAVYKFNVIDNQGWSEDKLSSYDRLPEKSKGSVRAAVWNLSRHSAGLKIRFKSNSGKITVRYQVNGAYEMPHMPATGVSGVDLYAKNSDGEWLWLRGRYSFGDTVRYEFSGINPKDAYHENGREYHLYLPLYNSVKWLEIGYEEQADFIPLPVRPERPIVVYGTSIAHGACASRPGMAWASILERGMDRPLINLGFSGNGRLEKEVIELIAEIDAKIYVLDCLPNLWPNEERSTEQVKKLILDAVTQLRQKRPAVPILLVDHGGYSDASLNLTRRDRVERVNKTNHEAFAALKADGHHDIYLLSGNELGLDFEAFVDGTHPTDLGMMEYARAYETKIREIVHEPVGPLVTMKPVTQMREPYHYDWEGRHRELLAMNEKNPPDICFLGNSITHFWGGRPEGPRREGVKSWDRTFEALNVRNFGYGWDRIENVLWRVYHGELDGFEAKQIVMKIGTNNLHLNSDDEIVDGLELLVEAVKHRQPDAEILILGLLPRTDQEERVAKLNLSIAALVGKLNVGYADIGRSMLTKGGKIDASCFSDGLHPNEKGYDSMGRELKKFLVR
ncbi:MAG: SGNH/GDSL hydrolase family protein [Cytophagales bacterium]|nr:SGNH/GDSL hydrolase family protein [Cytophagales bacterium]